MASALLATRRRPPDFLALSWSLDPPTLGALLAVGILLNTWRPPDCGQQGHFGFLGAYLSTPRLIAVLRLPYFWLLDAVLCYPTSSWSPTLSWMLNALLAAQCPPTRSPLGALLAARRPRGHLARRWLL